MNTLHFSVLSYFPSLLSDERINVGIAFHSENTNGYEFYYIKKWSRVETFDDEVDIDILKLTVQGIKNKLEYTLDNNPVANLFDFTRHFVNELKFSSIQTIICDNINSTIDLTKKVHLRFDFEKHERLNENSQKKYLRMLLKSGQCNYNTKPLIGNFNERVPFDFVINNNECIKIVRLNNRNTQKMIHHIKSWAFTSSELTKKYKIYFLISDDDLIDNTASDTIKAILLSSGATVINYENYVSNFHSSDLLSFSN